MQTFGKVYLNGRLGKDPELRQTQTGKAVANLSLAFDSGYGDNKKTNWVDVTVWDKVAISCGEYLKKGSELFVEGVLEQDTYETDSGKRSKLKVVAREVLFGAKPKDDASEIPF